MIRSANHPLPIALALALCSCAAPRAVVVEESAAAVAAQDPDKEEETGEVSKPVIAGPPDDGIRLPDMLTLPGDNEFRRQRPPGAEQGSGSGAVIARPPAEP